MKKLLTLSSILILAAFGLTACGDAANTTNTTANRGNMNTMNANMMSANAMNANMANGNTAVVVNSNANNMSMDANPTDAKGFMTKAAQSGMAEVEISRMAATKATNAEVKQFAQRMVQDHTNANTELKALAAKENVTLPTEVDAEHKEVMQKLNGLSGAEFDRAFMERQVEHHEKDVNLFQAQADKGEDAEGKAFAVKTLPTLKSHLEMARDLNNKVK